MRGLFVCLVVLALLGAGVVVRAARETAAPAEAAPTVRRLTRDGAFKQHLHWSPDGRRLLMTRIFKGQMGLWTVEADGSHLQPLLTPAANTAHLDGHWSPDSKKVLFVLDVFHGTDGKFQINQVNADGTNSQVVIPNKGFEESPRWSPDGRRLAWVSTRDGNQEIYSAALDGSGIQRLTNEIALDNNPAWSPDGRHLAFASARAGNFEIYTMKADGTEVRRLTNHPAVDCWPAWSPDAKQIAFTSNRGGGHDVYVLEVLP